MPAFPAHILGCLPSPMRCCADSPHCVGPHFPASPCPGCFGSGAPLSLISGCCAKSTVPRRRTQAATLSHPRRVCVIPVPRPRCRKPLALYVIGCPGPCIESRRAPGAHGVADSTEGPFRARTGLTCFHQQLQSRGQRQKCKIGLAWRRPGAASRSRAGHGHTAPLEEARLLSGCMLAATCVWPPRRARTAPRAHGEP